MFSLHERTQRKVCRMAFVVLCTVPTFVTLCWMLYFHRPWQEQDWRRALESALHVRIEVAHISAPRPGERTIESVRLATLQGREPLAEVEELNIAATDSLAMASATVHWDRLATLVQTGEVWLAGEGFQPARWKIARLTLVNSSGMTCHLRDLRCEAKRGLKGVRQWMVEAKHDGKPVRLLVERDLSGNFHTTIDAQQAALPAWLLARIPGGSRWDEAMFTGTIRLHRDGSQGTGELRGEVAGIDMRRWLASDALQTIATLHLARLTWKDNRIETVQGTLDAANGQISHNLLTLLEEKFRCRVALDPSQRNQDEFQPFDKLSCQFQLNTEGLTITGRYAWGETEKGCVMTTAGQPLVSIPTIPTLPLAQLVQLVIRHDPYWLPANREATDMAEKLPLPVAVPTTKK